MSEPSTFVRYGLGHCLALVLTVLIPVGLAYATRRHALTTSRLLALLLFFGLLGSKYLSRLLEVVAGQAVLAYSLPMHLCDWALFAATAALFWHHPLAFELSWCWGFAGTLQALLTPDLKFGFDDYRAWIFFIGHSAILGAGLYLAVAAGMRPRPGVVLRAWAWTQVYFVSALLVNVLCRTNYGYVCGKPSLPSLLDHLGPWPWYLIVLQILAVVLYTVAVVPFWLSGGLPPGGRCEQRTPTTELPNF